MNADAWEDGAPFSAFLHGWQAPLLKVLLRFTFVDRNGQVTTREALTHAFASNGKDGAIRAHCKLRDADRVFVMSRMSNVVDVETGEQIRDLPNWMTDRHATSPHGKMRQFINDHEAELGLLAAMARADGSLRGPERAQIALWCMQHGAAPAIAALVAKEIRGWFSPSAIAIGRWLRSLKDTPSSHRESVLKAMEAIIGTDKKTRDSETRLLARATKELRDR